jgi:hypothetical protein
VFEGLAEQIQPIVFPKVQQPWSIGVVDRCSVFEGSAEAAFTPPFQTVSQNLLIYIYIYIYI